MRGSQRFLLLIVLGACAEPFDAPSAYDGQRYLCAPELADVWDARVEACRAAWEDDESCAGVASFQGVLEGLDVTVETDGSWSRFSNVRRADESIWRHEFQFVGSSPYFLFNIRYQNVGGLVAGDVERVLQMGVGVEGEELEDSYTEGSLRLTASGASVVSMARGGELTVLRQSEREQVVTFTAQYDEDDYVEGCLHAFPLITRTESED